MTCSCRKPSPIQPIINNITITVNDSVVTSVIEEAARQSAREFLLSHEPLAAFAPIVTVNGQVVRNYTLTANRITFSEDVPDEASVCCHYTYLLD